MRSDDALAAYRELSARYQTDEWTEPTGLPEHLGRLRAILDDGTASEVYPEPFGFARETIPAYLADWQAYARDLAAADMDDTVRTRVQAEVTDKLGRATALASAHDTAYVEVERAQVGLPGPGLVATACQILGGDLTAVPFDVRPADADAPETVSSADMQTRMAAALEAYGLDEWTAVEEPNMTAQASVNGPRRRVRVRTGATFTPAAADRLLAHEVGGHVLRWANSQDQPEPWVSVALGQTVPTEEGMAAWREVEFGLQSEQQLRVYAARAVAVDAAQRLGLVGVARLVQPYVGTRRAAEIAIRAKRGLRDPNGPGGQTKDWGYLAGLFLMSDLARADPAALRLMASVKWPLDDLALVRALHTEGRVTLPQRLPDASKLGLRTTGLVSPE